MRPPHRLCRLAAGLALVVSGAGCSHALPEASPPGPHAAPAGAADCNDLPAIGGDPGILLGTDWSGEHHDYGDTVIVFACVSTSLGGEVSLVANGGIQIQPAVVTVDPAGSGIIAFRVTVPRAAAGAVRVQQKGGGGGGDLQGPVVEADGSGWHFVRHPG
jgi:hypothetical protein